MLLVRQYVVFIARDNVFGVYIYVHLNYNYFKISFRARSFRLRKCKISFRRLERGTV